MTLQLKSIWSFSCRAGKSKGFWNYKGIYNYADECSFWNQVLISSFSLFVWWYYYPFTYKILQLHFIAVRSIWNFTVILKVEMVQRWPEAYIAIMNRKEQFLYLFLILSVMNAIIHHQSVFFHCISEINQNILFTFPHKHIIVEI